MSEGAINGTLGKREIVSGVLQVYGEGGMQWRVSSLPAHWNEDSESLLHWSVKGTANFFDYFPFTKARFTLEIEKQSQLFKTEANSTRNETVSTYLGARLKKCFCYCDG